MFFGKNKGWDRSVPSRTNALQKSKASVPMSMPSDYSRAAPNMTNNVAGSSPQPYSPPRAPSNKGGATRGQTRAEIAQGLRTAFKPLADKMSNRMGKAASKAKRKINRMNKRMK